MIHIIRQRAKPEQMRQMLEALGIDIKLAVDLERRILAGGGELHADCELVLLDDGGQQRHVWGADWYPLSQTVGYESLINIRPSANNRSMMIQDPSLRDDSASLCSLCWATFNGNKLGHSQGAVPPGQPSDSARQFGAELDAHSTAGPQWH